MIGRFTDQRTGHHEWLANVIGLPPAAVPRSYLRCDPLHCCPRSSAPLDVGKPRRLRCRSAGGPACRPLPQRTARRQLQCHAVLDQSGGAVELVVRDRQHGLRQAGGQRLCGRADVAVAHQRGQPRQSSASEGA